MRVGKLILLASGIVVLTLSGARIAAANNGIGGPIMCGTDLAITWTPTTLWPPNHKLVTVEITATDNDMDSDSFKIMVTGITENQEPPGLGCGKPNPLQGPDFSGIGNNASGTDPGSATTSVQLRAERCGDLKSDRVYTITLSCTDEGMPGMATLTVNVPHNK